LPFAVVCVRYEEAVKLALTVDEIKGESGVAVAKRIASAAPEPRPFAGEAGTGDSKLAAAAPIAATSLRRRLWLLVARHVCGTVGARDPKQALRLLDECPSYADAFSSSSAEGNDGGDGKGSSGSGAGGGKGAGRSGPVLTIEDVLPFFGDFKEVTGTGHARNLLEVRKGCLAKEVRRRGRIPDG
jgi:hypothetical protein